MTVKWTVKIEQRFTELRLRKLSGNLTEAEQKELAKIRAMVEVVEIETAAPVLKKLESEQLALEKVLNNLMIENSELMQIIRRMNEYP